MGVIDLEGQVIIKNSRCVCVWMFLIPQLNPFQLTNSNES